jgi:hypothetical protein
MGEKNVNENGNWKYHPKPSRMIDISLGLQEDFFGFIGGVIGLIFIPELGVSAILALILGIVCSLFVTKNAKWGG